MSNDREKKKNPFIMVKDIVMEWPLSIKIGAVVFLIAILLAGGIYNNYSYKNEFVSLYQSEIFPDEIDEMTALLIRKGFVQGEDFDVLKSDDGSSIVAQRQLAGTIRSELEEEGYPRNDSVIEKSNITATEDERDRTARLEQEQGLAKQIRAMDGVKSAVVNLVPHQEAFFASEDRPAKSSITVGLKDGYRMSISQTASIMNIVAGAVEGLTIENVKVIGSDGIIYSDRVHSQNDPEGEIPIDIKEAHTRDMQDRIVKNAQEMLDGILGPGKSRVTVNIDMNFDGVSREMVVYGNPAAQGDGYEHAGPVDGETITIGGRLISYNTTSDGMAPPSNGSHIRSLEVMKEKYKNKTPDESKEEGSEYEDIEQRLNYELDQTKTVVVESPGKIERITVALALDCIPEKYVGDITSVVAASVGLDESRGDMISLVNMPFPGNVDPVIPYPGVVDPKPANPFGFLNSGFAGFAGFALALFAIMIMALYVSKKNRSDRQRMELNLSSVPPSSYHTITGLLEDKSGNTVSPSVNGNTNQHLTSWAREKPNEVAAKLMSSWMKG